MPTTIPAAWLASVAASLVEHRSTARGQRPNHRIARTVTSYTWRRVWNVPGDALSSYKLILFAACNKHRLASQTLSYDRAGLVAGLIVIAVHPAACVASR